MENFHNIHSRRGNGTNKISKRGIRPYIHDILTQDQSMKSRFPLQTTPRTISQRNCLSFEENHSSRQAILQALQMKNLNPVWDRKLQISCQKGQHSEERVEEEAFLDIAISSATWYLDLTVYSPLLSKDH